MQEEFDISKEFKLPSKDTIRNMKVLNNKILILIFVLILLIVVGFFGYQFIAPFGSKISYQFSSQDVDKLSKLDGAVSSKNIDNKATNTIVIPQQIIRQDIVTFNLKVLSKKIDGIWVNLKFKGVPKELKIGVKGKLKDSYLYKPLYENFLEGLKDSENVDELIFWQKEKRYKNFSRFIENPPQDKKIVVYNFDSTEVPQIISKMDSSRKNNQTTFNTILRSSHFFFVKVDNDQLDLTVEKQDLNMYSGEDMLLIEVYKGNKKISTKEIPDDSMVDATGLKLAPQKEKIQLKDLEKGIYKINLIDKSGSGDISIKSITVNKKNMIVLPELFVINDRPTKVWTNSKNISLMTLHLGGLQKVVIDKKINVDIKEKEKEYTINLNENQESISTTSAQKMHLLEIPKNDLVIKGDGVFSFSEDSFFDPILFKTLDLNKVSDVNDIDYIIANYKKAIKDGDWKITQVYFDPKDVKIEGDKLYFSLESSDLRNYGGEIAIDSLEVTVEKPGWFSPKQNSKVGILEDKPKDEENIVDKVIKLLGNIWPFGKEDQLQDEIETKEGKVTPSKKISPTTKATPTLATKENIKISIQNGGAAPGTASRYKDLLIKEGFKNIDAVNASSSGYKNVTILINKDEEKNLSSTVEDIKKILKTEYKTINSDYQKDKGVITILLGSLGTTLSPSPTIKPK